MNQLEINVVESFRLAKNDIIRMQNTIATLTQQQEKLLEIIGDNRVKETSLYQTVKSLSYKVHTLDQKKQAVAKKSVHKKKFLASKTGKKVHESNCPFAKNIKPKSRVVFQSKTKAFNAGYKACDCIKKI